MKRLTVVLIFAMALALVAAACGGGDDDDAPVIAPTPTTLPETTTAPPTTTPPAVSAGVSEVNVDLAEFAIGIDNAVGAAGDITFTASNNGFIPHELVVIRTDLAPDALPVDEASAKADEDAAGTVIGRIPEGDLGKGASASASFNLTPGNYVLICNVPGHYQSGMATAFTVN